MERVSQNDQGGTVLLKEQESYPGGECCLARLLLVRREEGPGFSVEVIKSGERSAVSVGRDPEIAVSFFSLVVSGTVTPITLSEIWEDFCYLQKNTKNPLLLGKVVI